MQGQIYIVPVGMMGNEFVTTVEICIPDLLLIITPGNSTAVDSIDTINEKYSNLKCIKEIEISEENVALFQDLKDAIDVHLDLEAKAFQELDEQVNQAVHEFQMQPQIQIASTDDLERLSEDFSENDDEGSGLILP